MGLPSVNALDENPETDPEHDIFPYVMLNPLDNRLATVWQRYDKDVTTRPEQHVYNDPSTNLYYSESTDGITWDPAQKVMDDTGVVDQIPALYAVGDELFITWMSASGTTPEVFDFPVAGIGNYPTGRVNVTQSYDEDHRIPGWSPRVIPTRENGLYLRSWTGKPDSDPARVYYELFRP